ncbi:hypothetical protein MFIFM68171_00325 [Madurella fahalii]|uniref:Uncharacterized protein n=1 Tax=Madurella fahalii TaxID=1157608 RepID=A0ABQ0FX82_9PEZI
MGDDNHAMVSRFFAGDILEKPEVLRSDHKSAAQDFDRRMLFLYKALCRLDLDSTVQTPPPVKPATLDDGIQNCKRIQHPPRGLRSCYDWAEHFVLSARQLLERGRSDFRLRGFYSDPHERCLQLGYTVVFETTGRWVPFWSGDAIFEYKPGHWGCVISDQTCIVGKGFSQQDVGDFFFRSELLACVGLLRRQMNKTLWDFGQHEFVGWELDVKEGPIKVTVVTFTQKRARIVQASCDPSSASPSLDLGLRASYLLGDGKTDYSEDRARSVLRWLLNPDGLSPPLFFDVQNLSPGRT